MKTKLLAAAANEFFGSIDAPPGVKDYGAANAYGLINFLNVILKISIYAAGIFALINFLISGIEYIGSGGKPEIIKKSSSRIWMSLLGITIIASSLALAALIGLIFYGDAAAIINPQIPGTIQP